MIPQGLAQGFLLLFASRFGMIFCSGGLDPVFQVWLSKITPQKRRGMVFGWAATARSIGWMVSPLAAGYVASRFSIRGLFFAGSFLYLLLIPCISLVVTQVIRRRNIAGD